MTPLAGITTWLVLPLNLGKNNGSFKCLFAMGGGRRCLQCTNKKWGKHTLLFFILLRQRDVNFKIQREIIECVFLMNSVWLHEEGLKKEKQIDIHNA